MNFTRENDRLGTRWGTGGDRGDRETGGVQVGDRGAGRTGEGTGEGTGGGQVGGTVYRESGTALSLWRWRRLGQRGEGDIQNETRQVCLALSKLLDLAVAYSTGNCHCGVW